MPPFSGTRSPRAKRVKDFADQSDLLLPFLREALQYNHAPRAFSFGIGLAQSTRPLADTWQTLRAAFIAIPTKARNATILGGFLHKLNETDAALCSALLDEILADPEMALHFVYLQARTEINEEALARLRKAITGERTTATDGAPLHCERHVCGRSRSLTLRDTGRRSDPPT